MDENEYNLIARVQGRHWWWLGRSRIIRALLAEHVGRRGELEVADVGAGFGAHVPLLLSHGRVTCIEANDLAVQALRTRWGGRISLIRATVPDPVGRRFDLILLADVLEHLEDDAAAVHWMHEHLNDGGTVVLTVPAHRFLWTQMDEVVGHRRRYRRAELNRLLAGRFEILKSSYYNIFLFPVKVGFVLFDRLKRLLLPQAEKRSYNDVPPEPINGLFGCILRAEAPLLRRFRLPWGVSLVVLARKRGPGAGAGSKEATA